MAANKPRSTSKQTFIVGEDVSFAGAFCVFYELLYVPFLNSKASGEHLFVSHIMVFLWPFLNARPLYLIVKVT